jgi:hypothetical protein
MLGVYDFCGYYEWTFEWLRRTGGESLVREYWDQAIAQDSQRHAAQLIQQQGFAGMAAYWGHTLEHEAAGYHRTAANAVFRIDMHFCPSKGFLARNCLKQYHDYCDHCLGWIGPLLRRAGYVVDHEHNHGGLCWWEIRHADDLTPPSQPGELAGPRDVRLRPDWERPAPLDCYRRATSPDDKTVVTWPCSRHPPVDSRP